MQKQPSVSLSLAEQTLVEADEIRAQDPVRGEQLARQAAQLARADGDLTTLAAAQQRVAVCLLSTGNHEECESWLKRAEDLALRIDSPRLVFDMHLTRGVLFANRGELVDAVQAYTSALEIAQRVDDDLPIIGVVNNLGGVFGAMRDFEAALRCYRQVRDEARSRKQPHNEALALVNIGECLIELTSYQEAREAFEAAQPILEEQDVYNLLPYLQAGLGDILSREGDHDAALPYLRSSVDSLRRQGNNQGLLQAVATLGRVFSRKGDLREAVRYMEEAIQIAKENEQPSEERNCCADLAAFYAREERWEEAYWVQRRLGELNEELVNLERSRSIREITARHQVEIHRLRNVELARANTKLRRAYDALEAERSEAAKARDAAEEASQAKSNFLANMSHEIRTPLNAVLGCCSILDRTDLTEEQREMVSLISTAGDLTLAIVGDILDLSKLENGTMELDTCPIEMRGLLKRVVALVESRPDAANLQLRVHVDHDVPKWVLGDEQRIQQVVLNLMSNAVKFTDWGWVDLYVKRTEHPDILRFEVRDTGVGIDESKVQALFDPFVQADHKDNRVHDGAGLGLALCRRFVSLFHGEIGAYPRVAGGSVFWFTATLPKSAPPVEARPEPVPEPVPEAKQSALRVLVAEDVPANQLVIRAMLSSFDVSVEVVGDGARAIARAALVDFDLILMDCRMPVVDGYTAASEILAASRLERAPVIVALTANALPEQRAHCIEVGMQEVITKPLRLEVLADLLERRFNVQMKNQPFD